MGVIPVGATDPEHAVMLGVADTGMPSDQHARGDAPAFPVSGRFQILALDGGGAKALFTARVLAHLEEDLGISIVDSFDLIAGTSAGGIVALSLGAGLRPSEIASHYEELVGTVFPAVRRRPWRRLSQANAPIYDANVLRAELTKVLGERTLGDSGKRLVIPSWDAQRGAVHIFKTPHHARLTRDWRIPMVDVALATSAAPLYFPAARVDGLRLIDGGIWANNPSVVAIAEAVSMLGVPLGNIKVLNIGTLDPITKHPKRLDRGGILQWAAPIAPLILNAGSRGSQGLAEHFLGKANYARFDAQVPGGLYGLDSADPADLAGLAASVSRNLSPIFTERFSGHQAAEYTPLSGRRGAPTNESAAEATHATR